MAAMQTITFNNVTFTGAGTVFLCGFGNKITWRNKFSSFSSIDKAVLQSSDSGTFERFSCSTCNPLKAFTLIPNEMLLMLLWVLSLNEVLCRTQENIVVSEQAVTNDTGVKSVERHENSSTGIGEFNGDNETEIYDENHPLVTIIDTRPHSMTLMMKPKDFYPDTMVRLLYERVNARRKLDMAYLDDPVIEYIPLISRVQRCDLTELPKGRYIVCGEAMVQGVVYQSSCCEIKIQRVQIRGKHTLKKKICLTFLFSIAAWSENSDFYCYPVSDNCDHIFNHLPSMEEKALPRIKSLIFKHYCIGVCFWAKIKL